MDTKALTRMESRMRVGEERRMMLEREERNRRAIRTQYENFTLMFIPLILLTSVVWLIMLGIRNVRSRLGEFSILQALGYRPWQIMALFLIKAATIGVIGGGAGLALGGAGGIICARLLGNPVSMITEVPLLTLVAVAVITITGAAGISLTSGWLPALVAANTDPATVLSREQGGLAGR